MATSIPVIQKIFLGSGDLPLHNPASTAHVPKKAAVDKESLARQRSDRLGPLERRFDRLAGLGQSRQYAENKTADPGRYKDGGDRPKRLVGRRSIAVGNTGCCLGTCAHDLLPSVGGVTRPAPLS